MNLELINSIASVATLLVIGATAIAALGQLRHMRSSNQIAALNECQEVLASESFGAALRFVRRDLPELMKDPATRARFTKSPLDDDLQSVTIVGNLFESMGSFVKHGVIDGEIAADIYAGVVIRVWDALVPTIAIMRRDDRPAFWENFEYLAAIMKDYDDRHPDGSYPKGVPRLPVVDVWKAEDEALGQFPRQ